MFFDTAGVFVHVISPMLVGRFLTLLRLRRLTLGRRTSWLGLTRLSLLLRLWRTRHSVILRLGLARWLSLVRLRLGLCPFRRRCTAFRSRRWLRAALLRRRPVVVGSTRACRRCIVRVLRRLRVLLSYRWTVAIAPSRWIFCSPRLRRLIVLRRTRGILLGPCLVLLRWSRNILWPMRLLVSLRRMLGIRLRSCLLVVLRWPWRILLPARFRITLRRTLSVSGPVYCGQARALGFWRSECSCLWCRDNRGSTPPR